MIIPAPKGTKEAEFLLTLPSLFKCRSGRKTSGLSQAVASVKAESKFINKTLPYDEWIYKCLSWHSHHFETFRRKYTLGIVWPRIWVSLMATRGGEVGAIVACRWTSIKNASMYGRLIKMIVIKFKRCFDMWRFSKVLWTVSQCRELIATNFVQFCLYFRLHLRIIDQVQNGETDWISRRVGSSWKQVQYQTHQLLI